jgi:tetratricopeptide (TPR) repeat protein
MRNSKKILLFLASFLSVTLTYSQTPNALLRKGNKLYKQGEFDKSISEYQKAVQIDPENPLANFNYGNALFRKEKWEDAEKNFQNVIDRSKDDVMRQQAFYNKGVALTKQKKLEESIEAYKNALRMNYNDEDARINLQKALLELKKKNESQQKQQKQEQKPKQKEKPKPQQSKFNKKEVERLLKALRQKEQEVQQKMQQNKTRGVSQPEKDW